MILKELKSMLSKETIIAFGLDKFDEDILLFGKSIAHDIYYLYEIDTAGGLYVSLNPQKMTFYEIECSYMQTFAQNTGTDIKYIEIKNLVNEGDIVLKSYEGLLISITE